VAYQLTALDGPFANWHRIVRSDENGRVELNELPTGTYDLIQKGDGWCRAESNRVDSAGHVVIDAGTVTTVWTFNCTAATPVGS
jgi:hypothetical protein